MIKKILKLIAVAQAVAFPAIKYPVQKADNSETTLETTLQATNILYQNAVVESLFITYPKNTLDIFNVCRYEGLIQLSPVSNLDYSIYFFCGKNAEDHPYNGLACIAYGTYEEWTTLEKYLDTSNLKVYSLTGNENNKGVFFGDCKHIPQEYINKNVLVNFKEPCFVRQVAPGIEKYVFNPKPVDKFALTYNGLLNGYAYNMVGGRQDINISEAHSYIKNHVTLQTEGFWKGQNVFKIATFKNGEDSFDIVGAIYNQSGNDFGLLTNYPGTKPGKFKTLSHYYINDDGTGAEIFSTHSQEIEKYYSCTIVDETAAKYVLTSGPDFSAFLDYAKSVGYPEGYGQGLTDGQNNPTFKSFIVSAFDACSAFFSLPVLGENITIGTLIGSFIGLGALFLIIKLFR